MNTILLTTRTEQIVTRAVGLGRASMLAQAHEAGATAGMIEAMRLGIQGVEDRWDDATDGVENGQYVPITQDDGEMVALLLEALIDVALAGYDGAPSPAAAAAIDDLRQWPGPKPLSVIARFG